MYNPIPSIKSQKPIIKLALAVILILVLIFALSLAIFKYTNIYNPEKNSGAAPQPPKTMQEIIESLTAPVSDKEQPPVSKEVLDSLTAPVKTNNASTPTPISKEIIDSLTAPAAK